MKMNIPLAGWLLSLATFICGTVVIPLYQRLSFDGFSVQQLSNVRSVSGDPSQHIVHFSTLLKVANVRTEPIIIEGLKAPNITVPKFSFEPSYSEFKFFGPGDTIALPPSNPVIVVLPDRGAVVLRDQGATTGFSQTVAPVFADFPPLILKSGDDKLLGITIYFSIKQTEAGKENEAGKALYNHIVEEGLPIRLSINGKYRRFKLQILPIGTNPPLS
jgi:hypothetical protein